MTPFDAEEGRALESQASRLRQQSIATLLAEDPQRAQALSREACGLHLDFSRQLLDASTLESLLALARRADMNRHIAALFRGDKVNTTEDRPALHTLLRARGTAGDPTRSSAVRETQDRMRDHVTSLRDGLRTGFRGDPIRDVVNIGIGGSDLGPRLASEALAASPPAPVNVHYVANIDPDDLGSTLQALNPATTLFIVCSKSFATEETLHNALAARHWLEGGGAGKHDLARHFLAATSNLQAAREFGIPAGNCLPLWDWVGGRYSLWSAVGLSTAIAIGWEDFSALLAGAEDMDRHFRDAAPERNLPLLMSLLEIWCCQYLGAHSYAVLPYAHRLRRLPDFLQQLTMESNGKGVNLQGEALGYHSAPVLWGGAGTTGQHSFHQLLHQGTRLCPVDFILPLSSAARNEDERHARLVANCLAQSRALVVGRSAEAAEASLRQRNYPGDAAALAPHLAIPGNRPHSILSFGAVKPQTLGAVLALYEHRTYCSSVLWGINAFDQWGVELGKEIGGQVYAAMSDGAPADSLDPATAALVQRWRDANA